MSADLAVSALATYRITRLVTTDEVTAALRDAVFNRYPDSKFSYLITCDHCVSVYAGVLVAAMDAVSTAGGTPQRGVFTSTVRVLRYALALSGAVSAYREVLDR